MAIIIIEILNRLGNCTERYKFNQLPITIGRGYQNDIILPDLYVSPSHLRLHADEEISTHWKIEDCDSDNGFVIKRQPDSKNAAENIRENYLASGDELILGHSRLRILSPDHPLPKTHLIHTAHPFKQLIKQPRFGIAIILLTLVVFLVNNQLLTTTETSLEKLIARSLPSIIGIILWSGLWAFVGRTIIHRTNFFAHLSITSLFAIFLVFINNAGDYISFYTSTLVISKTLVFFLTGIALITLLSINLENATLIKYHTRLKITHAITWSLLLFATFTDLANRPDFYLSPKFPAVLKPPYVHLLPARDIETFFKESENIFDIPVSSE